MKNRYRSLLLAGLALALLWQTDAHATWDKTKPATSSAIVSAEIRTNWAALETALGSVNLVADPTFVIWPAETVNTDSATTTQLAHWLLSGASATLRRTGTGLSDTNRKVGTFAAKVVAGGGAPAVLNQDLLPNAGFEDSFRGRTISECAWLKTSTITAVRVRIYDGVTATYSGYHSGGSAWEWLCATATIGGAASQLSASVEVATSQTAYISGVTAIFGDIQPAYFLPAPVVRGDVRLELDGTVTTGTLKDMFYFSRPAIVTDVVLRAGTAPTGAALIIDVNQGSGVQSMFTTRPQILAGANGGAAAPDGTYRYRCFQAGFAIDTDALLSYDVDQVGSGTAGANLFVVVHYIQFARPLEQFLNYDAVR